jgi:hypothetical protein
VEFDIVEIASKYPLSMWSLFMLGFILTFLNIFTADQWDALFISSTISLFILAPIIELKPSLTKKLVMFPIPIIVSYAIWILNFIGTHRPIPELTNQLTQFFGPVFLGTLLFIIWFNVNNSIKERLIKLKKPTYLSGLITTPLIILLGLAIIMPLNLIGLIV